ncbi:hypothetical protein SUGI_0430190 [Cryptomeria japonica]|nr:hypothetical protein SUGI_0430190 [Cryptomeria japonica]
MPSETEEGSSITVENYDEGSSITVENYDGMWRLALPVGSNRDHRYSDPFAEGDKELEYCEALKKWGKQIEVHTFAEEDHGFTIMKMEGQSSLQVLGLIADFVKLNVT